MTDDHVHVSDLRWDRLLADELAADAKAEVLAAANACAVCGARLAELRRDSDAFAQRPPFVVARPGARRWWLAAPAVLAAAAAVLLVVRMREETVPGERTKGIEPNGPELVLASGAPGRMSIVSSGDPVRPGDHVQAAYSGEVPGFGAVLGRDGTGRAAVHVPAGGDAMISLPAGRDRSYPASTVLDDVPGDETFVVVWCWKATPLAPLLAELEARGDITDSKHCVHRTVVLAKDAR